MTRIFSILVVLLLCLVCTEFKDDNPYDPDWKGDYFLEVGWDSIPDTLGTFIEYRIPFTHSVGDERLKNFSPVDTLQTIIDTAVFKQSDSAGFRLYFIKEYNGSITIAGRALNDRVVPDSGAVLLVNPFEIAAFPPVEFGEQMHCILDVKNQFDSLFTVDSTDSVIWGYWSNISDTLSIRDTLTFTIRSLDSCTVTARFKDGAGHIGSIVSRSWLVVKIAPVVTVVSAFSYRVATVHIPVVFSDSNDLVDSVFCIFKDSTVVKDTVRYSTGDTISFFTDYTPIVDPEPVQVWVKDKSGLVSNRDTTILTTFIPDSVDPTISLYKFTDTVTVGTADPSIKFVAKDNYGIDSVTATVNSNMFAGTRENDSVWNVIVGDSLTVNLYTLVSATAIDSFGNSGSFSFWVLYDPSALDTKLPSLTLQSAPFSKNRITVDTGIIVVRAFDENGIDSLFLTINGTMDTLFTETADSIYILPFALDSNFGNNTFSIAAVDNSYYNNRITIDTIINYNTYPTGITNISPADGAAEIESLNGVTFSWDHATDADGDVITYTLYYGQNSNLLTSHELVEDSLKADDIERDVKYYWYVDVMTNLDTVRCPAAGSYYTFYTTLNDLTPPQIKLRYPVTDNNSTRVTSSSDSVVITVTDLVDVNDRGIDTVYYLINGTYAGAADKKNDTTYTFIYTLPGFNWNTITIVASDNSGQANTATCSLLVNYNTLPGTISNISPSDEANNIENIGGVTFSWDHATDADGDVISYTLYYGTDQGSLAPYAVTGNSYQANDLAGGKKHYWYVNVVTDLDTIRCPSADTFYSFETRDHPATVSVSYNGSTSIDDLVEFTVTASDPEGIQEYYWDFDTDGINEDTVTIPTVTHAYNSDITYTVTVTVVDNNNNITTQATTITITDEFPTIDAYPDSAVNHMFVGYNDLIFLTPSANDDGRIMTYEWSFDTGHSFDTLNDSSGDTTFLAGIQDLPKEYMYIFKATDDDGHFKYDTLYVTVNMLWTPIDDDAWILNRLLFPVVNDSNEIFVLGGVDGGTPKNDVWRSTNGVTWTEISESPSFTARNSHAATIKHDTLLIAGGANAHDIWRSIDRGVTWNLCADLADLDANYSSKLSGAELVTWNNNDSIYLLGGRYNDLQVSKRVFSTSSGSSWNPLVIYEGSSTHRFKSTDKISPAIYNDTLCLFAEGELWHANPVPFADSWDKDSTVSELNLTARILDYNNILYAVDGGTFWYSRDRGKIWLRMTSSCPWSSGLYQRLIVFKGKMWIFTEKGIWSSTDTP